MPLPYYKRFPRDFLEGTIGLSFEEKGAYGIILDLIYMRDGRLEDDSRFICGLLNCTPKRWFRIRAGLLERGKLIINDGIISTKRSDNLLETSRKFLEKQAENGSKPKKNNGVTGAVAKPGRKPKANQSESESKETPKGPLEGVFAEGQRTLSEVARDIWEAQPEIDGVRRTALGDVLFKLDAAVEVGAHPEEVLAACRAYYATRAAQREGGQFSKSVGKLLENDLWREYRNAKPADAKPAPADQVLVETQTWDRRARRWAKAWTWDPQWGPRPDEPGCLMPDRFYDQFGITRYSAEITPIETAKAS